MCIRDRACHDKIIKQSLSGFPIATALLFYHDKLYTGDEPERLYWTGVTYLTAVICVLVFSFLQRSGYRTVKLLMAALGLLFVGIPMVNAAMTELTIIPPFDTEGELITYGVDLSLLAIGLCTLFISLKIKATEEAERDVTKEETRFVLIE